MSRPPLHAVIPEVRRTLVGLNYDVHHCHPQIELNLVMGGRGSLDIEGVHHPLGPGSLIWVLPCQDHMLRRDADFDMWLAISEPEWLDSAFFEQLDGCQHRTLSSAEVMELDQLMRIVAQETDDPATLRSGIVHVMRRARRSALTTSGPAGRRLHPAVLAAIAILRENSEAPGSDELARLCGVTRDYLGQLFVEQTGRGLVDWRNRTRLERFHLLYPESSDLLTAALAAGFGSYTQFHRVFTEIAGVTPGQWAKSGAGLERLQPASAPNLQGDGLLWDRLSASVPPAMPRWLLAGFATRFSAAGAGEDGPPVDAAFRNLSDLRLCEPQLVADLETTDAELAATLARVFADNDVFETYRRIYHGYALPLEDIGNLLTLYIATAWPGATGGPVLAPQRIRGLAGRVRSALQANRQFDRATATERRHFAAATIAQSVFMYSSLFSSRSSGSPARTELTADKVHRSAMESIGLDLRAFDLNG